MVPTPALTAISISSSVFAFPCITIFAGLTPAASAITNSPPPATSTPSPSSPMRRKTEVSGSDLEAQITSELGHLLRNPTR